jgi:hypothetical protein
VREVGSQQFMDVHDVYGHPARAGAGIEEGGQIVVIQSAPVLVLSLDRAAHWLGLFRSVRREARERR